MASDEERAHEPVVPDEDVTLLHRVQVPHADLVVLAAAVHGRVGHGQAVDLRVTSYKVTKLQSYKVTKLQLQSHGQAVDLRARGVTKLQSYKATKQGNCLFL